MTRFRALALLALGCVVAAAAASTGPFLEADRTVPPFRIERRSFAIRPDRLRRGGSSEDGGIADHVGLAFEIVVLAVLAGVVLYGAYRLVARLVRLRRLRLAEGDADVRTSAYDGGEESRDDAETALRRRVAEELRLLSADLDRDVDAREAVIACYVRMEAALAAAGTPRGATETPLELMERVLDSFAVPAAEVRRLTELFTEARFSRHPVTEEMRRSARRSLAAVADALAVRA